MRKYLLAIIIAAACTGCSAIDPETTGKVDSWLRTICRWCL